MFINEETDFKVKEQDLEQSPDNVHVIVAYQRLISLYLSGRGIANMASKQQINIDVVSDVI